MLASVHPTAAGGAADVRFARSTNGGVSFSASMRINDDAVNASKWHWMGTLSVAPNGRIDSVWLDTRNAANNTDSQLFYSYSTDGGVTWAPNVSVSNSFNPFLGYPQQNKMGDYMTIVSDNTGANVAYAATFNLEEDIYYVRVSPSGGGTPTPTPSALVTTATNNAHADTRCNTNTYSWDDAHADACCNTNTYSWDDAHAHACCNTNTYSWDNAHAHTCCNTNTHSWDDAHADAWCNTNTYSWVDSHAHAWGNLNTYSYSWSDTDTDSNPWGKCDPRPDATSAGP